MAPGNRAVETLLRAYMDASVEAAIRHEVRLRNEPIDWEAYETPPVAQDAPQGGHPYRGGPWTPEPDKSRWRAFWGRLRAFFG